MLYSNCYDCCLFLPSVKSYLRYIVTLIVYYLVVLFDCPIKKRFCYSKELSSEYLSIHSTGTFISGVAYWTLQTTNSTNSNTPDIFVVDFNLLSI